MGVFCDPCSDDNHTFACWLIACGARLSRVCVKLAMRFGRGLALSRSGLGGALLVMALESSYLIGVAVGCPGRLRAACLVPSLQAHRM